MSTIINRIIMNFPIRLKKALKHKGVNQSELARAINSKPSTISDWMSGRIASPTADLIIKAANHLHVSATWLSTGKGSMVETSISEKDLILDCLKAILSRYPDIEPQKLLVAGNMLFNESKSSGEVAVGQIDRFMSLLE